MKKKKIVLCLLMTSLIISIPNYKANAVQVFGDVNGDNLVDVKDLAIVSQYYNTNTAKGDVNKDGLVDIYDITIMAKNINNARYKVHDSKGYFIRGYDNGQLVQASNHAGSQNGAVINSSGTVLWDNTGYYVLNGENLLQKYNDLYSAGIRGDSQTSALVLDKQGQVFLNRSQNYRALLGRTQDVLWLRTAPSDTSYTKVMDVPYNATVEITERLKDFYGVKYFNPSDNKMYTGYIKRKGAWGANLIDPFTDNYPYDALGYISETYESNGDAGSISSGVGDAGGVSYGAFQFSSKMGSLADFVIWLKGVHPTYHNQLNNAFIQDGYTYGTNFNNAWKSIAQADFNGFYNLQHTFIRIKFYDVMINKLKNSGVDYTSRLNSFAVRNMLWSIAVQHGQTGGFNLVSKSAAINNDINFIDSVYDERSQVEKYFSTSSKEVQEAVRSRFVRERAYVKRVYNYETTY